MFRDKERMLPEPKNQSCARKRAHDTAWISSPGAPSGGRFGAGGRTGFVRRYAASLSGMYCLYARAVASSFPFGGSLREAPIGAALSSIGHSSRQVSARPARRARILSLSRRLSRIRVVSPVVGFLHDTPSLKQSTRMRSSRSTTCPVSGEFGFDIGTPSPLTWRRRNCESAATPGPCVPSWRRFCDRAAASA